jgi:hypothetical protein
MNSMSKAWSIIGRALVGFLVIACGAALLAPQFSSVSISTHTDREEEVQSRIELALQQPVTLEFVDTPLKDVMAYIAKESGVDVVLSRKIEDAGVQPDQPVTRSCSNISLEAFLNRMLSDLNLTLMVRNESIYVTTVEDAQSPENMYIRVYPVADLADYYRLPAKEGGTVEMDFDTLIDLVTSTIEPDSWQDVGGPGAIYGHEQSRTLVVSTRRDIHHKLAGMINTIRRAKRLQALSMPSMPISSATSLPGSPGFSGSLPVKSRLPARPAVGGGPVVGGLGSGGGIF